MSLHPILQDKIERYFPKEYLGQPEFDEFLQQISLSLNNESVNNDDNDVLENSDTTIKLDCEYIFDLFQEIDFEIDESIITHKGNDWVTLIQCLKQEFDALKLTKSDLNRTVELFKTLLANLQSGILVEDENRMILFTNTLFCDTFNIPVAPEFMIGIDCTDSAEQSKHLFKNPEAFSPRIETILKERILVTNELLETVDNRFLERDYVPIFIENEYKGHLWKYTDVTQRIKFNALLEQSEQRSRLIMNSSLNGIITFDEKGSISFWNEQASQIFGWEKEEVIGKSIMDIIFVNTFKGDEKTLESYLKNNEAAILKKQIELVAQNKAGASFPIEISIIPIVQDNESFFCSFIQDISERKQAEDNLKFQVEKYRNIIANMNLGLVEVDNDEVIRYVNQSFSEISGYDIDELMGSVPSNFLVFGENLDAMNNRKAKRRTGANEIYEVPIKNKRGELRWWAISASPNYDNQRNIIGSIGIHLDITDQKLLEFELENEKNKAIEASKAKESFLANMSHEIRTPLNAIIGFQRELLKQNLNPIQKQFVENSNVASQHLLSIINNVLDISKIESGEMSLENTDFDFEDIVSKVLQILQEKASFKGILLKASFAPGIAKVLKGDPLRIEQILFNLIGNSLKFTNKGGIKVDCILNKESGAKQNITIEITDTGIGMEQSYVDAIFNKFSQENSSVTRKFGGTGLGMAITKQLVELMKGNIKIYSEKNIGTKISINLTLEKGNIDNLKKATSSNNIDLTNVKVLLVEDNEFNRMVAQNSLSNLKCVVTEATNGLEAIKLLKKQDFDIVLMDIQMPEMDGIEATKVIRKKLKLNLPIIALTANAFKSEIENCKNAGMDDYISKPFDEQALIASMSKYISIKQSQKIQEMQQQNSESLYSLNTLEAISKGNQEFVQKMVNIFLDQTKDTLKKIDTAFENEDYAEIGRLIHKIKPSIESLGILSIMDDVRQLEVLGKELQEPQKMKLLYLNIEKVLLSVILDLEQLKFNS